MTDIVKRLRTWCHAPDAASAQDLMDEAAAEIERLRNGASAGCETVLLTDDEREAIAFGIACVTTDKHAAALRKLLERLHT